MTVHVTLDEKGPRLPADVESELLRIAQEAMANARKHSGAANLWLRCRCARRTPRSRSATTASGRTRREATRRDCRSCRSARGASAADLIIEEPTEKRPAPASGCASVPTVRDAPDNLHER